MIQMAADTSVGPSTLAVSQIAASLPLSASDGILGGFGLHPQ